MYKYLGNTEILMYDIINMFCAVAAILTNFADFKKKSVFLSNTSQRIINKTKIKYANSFLSDPKTFTIIEILIISMAQCVLTPFLNSKFGHLLSTGANYFATMYLYPFIMLIFFYIIKIAPLKQLDMITPAFVASLFFAKIACFCAGCCNGIEWGHTFYNIKTERYEFPIQLIEAALALFIFIFLLWYRKKAKEGTMFSIYLILYSGTRFFSEFLSADPNVLWIFKTYHLLCIAGVILGIAELILVQKYKDKINKFYEPKKKARIKF